MTRRGKLTRQGKLAFARNSAINVRPTNHLLRTMKKHHFVALYALLFACAGSAYCWLSLGWPWGWALLASVKWQSASLGLFLERKWAPPFTFGLFGFALVMTLGLGFVFLVTGVANLQDTPTYLIICLALFLPMKLLSSWEVKKTFGLRINDPEPENQITEKEQA